MFTKIIRYMLRILNVALAGTVATILFGPQISASAATLLRLRAPEEKQHFNTTGIHKHITPVVHISPLKDSNAAKKALSTASPSPHPIIPSFKTATPKPVNTKSVPVVTAPTPTHTSTPKPTPTPSSSSSGSSSHAAGDDYPWADGSTYGMSPLGYDLRDCTDFVAWRINRDAGHTSAPWAWTWSNLRLTDGDAYGWRLDWQLHGWRTGISPVPGSIAWFAYDHVAYVQAVHGDMVTLEEYNWEGSQSYHTRTIPASDVDSFLASPAS